MSKNINISEKIEKNLKKIEKILEKNKEEKKFNNINFLVYKTILKNISLLEKDQYIQDLIIKRIKHLLKTNTNNINTIYTHNQNLTKLSEEVILNIYRKYGFKACINSCVIKEYYQSNNIDFNLFFNQVDNEYEVVVDYFKLEDCENALLNCESGCLNIHLNKI